MSEDIDDSAPDSRAAALPRRAILKGLAALGIGSATFRRAVAAQAVEAGKVTPEMIKQAEWIAGLELTEDERKATADVDPADPRLVRGPAQGRRWATRSRRPSRSSPRRA